MKYGWTVNKKTSLVVKDKRGFFCVSATKMIVQRGHGSKNIEKTCGRIMLTAGLGSATKKRYPAIFLTGLELSDKSVSYRLISGNIV